MEKQRFNWVSFCTGILFIIVAFLTMWHPQTGVMGIIVVIALTSIIEGLGEIFFKYKMHQWFGVLGSRGITTFFGILLVVIGVILLLNMNFSMAVFPYVFAVWIVLDSVENLFLLPFARLVSKGYYWFCLIAAALGVVVGIWLFFIPATSTMVFSCLLTLFFAWFGVQYIWEAFATRRI